MSLTDTLSTDQHRTLENIRAAADRLWAHPLHRYYTDHTPDHSQRIIALLDGLTAGMMQTDKSLASTEAFTLLAAAYLHDIGMQDERFAGGDLETIRAYHHEQTAEMIYRVFEDPARAFALPLGDDPGLLEAIALVARGHRKVDLNAPEYDSFPLGGEMVRPRLLAALLRFADELDIDHRRVDLELMKVMDLPLVSRLHWWKCHYVSGVSIVDEYIRVTYRFPRDRQDYEQLLIPLIEGEIRAKHAALEPIFRRHAVKVAIGQPQVRLMRLVRPMPPEVEALAREGAAGKPENAGAEMLLPTCHSERSEESPAAPPATFDQQGQTVGTQINIAGNFSVSPTAWPAQHGQQAKEYERLRELALRAGRESDLDVMGIAAVAARAKQDHPPTELEKLMHRASDDHDISGIDRVKARRRAAEYEAALVAYWEKWKAAPTTPDAAPPAVDMAPMRALLARLDSVEIESLCLDHFPQVYDKFGRGQRRDEMINLLLDHCRRNPEDAARLAALLT